ncbi:MAG: glycosyltransferase family 39 protein, partial [Candidatus Omnitrophica bacterium]|nr:glycosyltransferase family 39 protein [Candidatus Omnitrophota bacterium]
EGWAGYHLRGIDNAVVEGVFREYYPAAPGDPGHLMKALKAEGTWYYDVPVLTTPPLLPLLIMSSHRIYPGREAPYRVFPWKLNISDATWVHKARPVIIRTQAYAAVWPFVFGLGLIAATYFLGRTLYPQGVGLVAAYLVATSPVVILCVHKVWADHPTAFFVTASVMCFVIAEQRGVVWPAALGGVCWALAALAKGTGLLPVPVVVLFRLWTARRHWRRPGIFIRSVADRRLLVFLGAGALLAGPWFVWMAKVYGYPLFNMSSAQTEKSADWFQSLGSRPRMLYVVNLFAQTPLLALSILWPFSRRRIRPALPGAVMMFVLAVAVLIYVLWNARELRYMMPVLPMIAILAAVVVEDARRSLAARWSPLGANVLTLLIVFASSVGSMWLGLSASYRGDALILFPL